MSSLRAAALAGGAALLGVSAAHARTPQVALLSPFTAPRASPPLHVASGGFETRFLGHLASLQAVAVSVDSSGEPVRIVDLDRIVIGRKGDYSFAIFAPAEKAEGVPGSQSQPGLRSNAVVWQGFSPGRRVLAARITLKPGEAASALPLRVEIRDGSVRLVNATPADVPATEAPARALEVARALDASRAALQADAPAPAAVVKAIGPARDVRLHAALPLRVRGTIRFGDGPSRPISTSVAAAPVVISGTGQVRSLALTVTVPEPASLLEPPGGASWLDLARRGRLQDGRAVTRLAENRLMAAALAGQFHEFLANPDATGVTSTSYRYKLVTNAARQSQESSGRRGGAWLALSIALGALAALVAALVLWAHS